MNLIIIFYLFIDLKYRQLWQLEFFMWLRLVEEHVYVRREFVTKNPDGHPSDVDQSLTLVHVSDSGQPSSHTRSQ